MKKVILFAISFVFVITMMPTVTFASTNIASAHDKALAKLTDACGYYGWCTDEEEIYSDKSKYITKFVGTVLYSSQTYKSSFKVKTLKTKKNKKVKYTSTYYVDNKKYSLSSIKTMLKNYSSDVGKKSTVKKSTIDISDELIELAKDCNWSVEITDRTEATNKYAQTISFTNNTYAWKAEVITERSDKYKKLIVSYKRDGVSSNKASIEEWLKKYSK